MADDIFAAESKCSGVKKVLTANDSKRESLLSIVLPAMDRLNFSLDSTDKQASENTKLTRGRYGRGSVEGLPLGEADDGDNLASFQQSGRNSNSILRGIGLLNVQSGIQTSLLIENRGVEQAKAGSCKVALASLNMASTLLDKVATTTSRLK